jgi:hypothetical protein
MLSDFLSDRANIYTRTTIIGELGDSKDTYVLLASEVGCRSMRNSNNFGQFGGRVSTQAVHIIYIDEGYVLDTTNTLEIDGQIYHVTNADAKYDSLGVHHNYYECEVIESPQSGKSIYG